MKKEELRAMYKVKRWSLNAEMYEAYNRRLLQLLRFFNFEKRNFLLSYYPLLEQHEPNTLLFTAFLKKTYPHLVVCYPKIEAEGEMVAIVPKAKTAFVRNRYGIAEPQEGQIIAPKDLDIIFVPLLICDIIGHRVGYGSGYYDRYLAKCRDFPDCIKMSFNYYKAIEKIEDMEKTDMTIDLLITPVEAQWFLLETFKDSFRDYII